MDSKILEKYFKDFLLHVAYILAFEQMEQF